MLNTSGIKQLLCPEPNAHAPLVLIYSKQSSPRLEYCCRFIFNTSLSIRFEIITSLDDFKKREGIKINYSDQDLQGTLMIKPFTLLFEKGVGDWVPVFESSEVNPEMFSRDDGHNFDIFSAVFYLISRYEEWQWYEGDEHQRFEAINSILVRANLHKAPVIEEWVIELRDALAIRFPGVNWPLREFRVLSTIDVDNLYAYKHKGFLRTLGATAKDLVTLDLINFFERIKVLMGFKKDPFDIYEEISDFCFEHKIPLFYFFLFKSGTMYDRSVSPESPAYAAVLKRLKENQAAVGIHPSYFSIEQDEMLQQEIRDFSKLLSQPLQFSRQHYLRYNIRQTPHWLMKAGIEVDFTMGFASEAGFRAGTSLPFHYYDFEKEAATNLIFMPFCMMDGVYTVYHQVENAQVQAEMLEMANATRKVNGIFTTVFHERSFSDHLYKGYGSLYKKVHEELSRPHV